MKTTKNFAFGNNFKKFVWKENEFRQVNTFEVKEYKLISRDSIDSNEHNKSFKGIFNFLTGELRMRISLEKPFANILTMFLDEPLQTYNTHVKRKYLWRE